MVFHPISWSGRDIAKVVWRCWPLDWAYLDWSLDLRAGGDAWRRRGFTGVEAGACWRWCVRATCRFRPWRAFIWRRASWPRWPSIWRWCRPSSCISTRPWCIGVDKFGDWSPRSSSSDPWDWTSSLICSSRIVTLACWKRARFAVARPTLSWCSSLAPSWWLSVASLSTSFSWVRKHFFMELRIQWLVGLSDLSNQNYH